MVLRRRSLDAACPFRGPWAKLGRRVLRSLSQAFVFQGKPGISTFTILLVAPRSIFRNALLGILSGLDYSTVTTASSVTEVSPEQLPRSRPVLLLIEPGNDRSALFSEIELFKQRHAAGNIALLADREQLVDEEILEAFRAGAHAYFVRPDRETFVKSLELVMLGEIILPPRLMNLVLGNRHIPSMTTRPTLPGEPSSAADDHYSPKLSLMETRILRRLMWGASKKTIARNYSIVEATVKIHVRAILRKFACAIAPRQRSGRSITIRACISLTKDCLLHP
jgi:two-component system nitrate/nitrite response regulator NarL